MAASGTLEFAAGEDVKHFEVCTGGWLGGCVPPRNLTVPPSGVDPPNHCSPGAAAAGGGAPSVAAAAHGGVYPPSTVAAAAAEVLNNINSRLKGAVDRELGGNL